MASELLTSARERSVKLTLKVELPASVYDLYREAAKLAKDLGRSWRPEAAVAKWLTQQTTTAVQELRQEKQQRTAGKQRESGRE